MATYDPASNDLAERLKAIELFARLDEQRLARVAGLARLECVPAGNVVIREKEPADELRALLEGRVAITIEVPGRGEQRMSTVSAGEIVGWSALLPQRVWLATARAQKNTTMAVFSGPELLALGEADHELGYHLMHGAFETVAARLQDSWLQALDMFAT